MPNYRFGLRIQPVEATHWLNRSGPTHAARELRTAGAPALASEWRVDVPIYCNCQATSEVPATKIRRFSPAAGPEGGMGPPFSLSVLIGTGDTPFHI